MDEKRTDLKAALRELAAEESGDAGPHVGVKRLIAYREGTLPAAERESVQEHLSLCPRCTALLLEMRDFEAAAAGIDAGPESLRREAWDSLEGRLPGKTPAVRPFASAARPQAQPRRRLSRVILAAAAALLLTVLGLALWAALTAQQERARLTRLEQQLEEREEALDSVRRSLAEAERQLDVARRRIQGFEKEMADRRPGRGEDASRVEELEARVTELTSELEELRRRDRTVVASREIEVSVAPRFSLRGQEPPGAGLLRGGGVVNPVRTPPREGRLTVALSLADHPTYGEYRLELMDRDGKLLWAGRRPGSSLLGDAGTSVSFDGLSPGLYRLRIEGLHPDRSELLAEYILEVEP